MTTDPDDEHGEILRRALHAEAESVVPSAEGLELIRRRIESRRGRRFGWAWFTESWARPLLAVAAAACITTVGTVAGPSTFGLITSVGNHGNVEKSQSPRGRDDNDQNLKGPGVTTEPPRAGGQEPTTGPSRTAAGGGKGSAPCRPVAAPPDPTQAASSAAPTTKAQCAASAKTPTATPSTPTSPPVDPTPTGGQSPPETPPPATPPAPQQEVVP